MDRHKVLSTLTNKRWIYVLSAIMAVAAAAAMAVFAPIRSADAGSAQAGAAQADGLYPSASDRFGFGVNPSYGTPTDFHVARLHAGWYVDWGVRPDPPQPAGLEHMQMVHVSEDRYSPDAATLAAIAAAKPDQTWMVGNEPDCIWQGNSTPDQYARVYHEVYATLKSADPTCQVAIGGIVQATPLRLQWLDAMRARYQVLYGRPLPADLWNIHAHILREERGAWGCDIPPGIDVRTGMLWEVEDHDRQDLLIGQIVRFRQWMADHGERDKALLVSEYGILMPDSLGFDTARVQAFMRFTFDYFTSATDPNLGYPADGNRLVQRWAWYSLNDRRFEGHTSWSHLFDPTSKEITGLGLAFENYVTPLHTPYVDLLPAAIHFTPVTLFSPDGQPVTVTLSATIRNAGNTDVEHVPVRFWHTAPNPAHFIGAIQTVVSLPARSLASVSLDWPGVAVGAHRVGVTVDGAAAIVESEESNNQLSRTLVVADQQIYLPLCLQEH